MLLDLTCRAAVPSAYSVMLRALKVGSFYNRSLEIRSSKVRRGLQGKELEELQKGMGTFRASTPKEPYKNERGDFVRPTITPTEHRQRMAAAAAKEGYKTLLSFGYYLDHLNLTSTYYHVDPLGGPASSLTPEEATQLGQMIGHLHQWDYDLPETFTRPRLDIGGLFGESGQYALGEALSLFTAEQISVMKAVVGRVSSVFRTLGVNDYQFGIVHGDLLLPNVIFGETLGILDLSLIHI